MGRRFVGNPEVLKARGTAIVNQGELFLENVNKVYSILGDMISNEYLDPAANAIAKEIEGYHDDLNNMAKIIAEYGGFVSKAAVVIRNNQNSIIENVTV